MKSYDRIPLASDQWTGHGNRRHVLVARPATRGQPCQEHAKRPVTTRTHTKMQKTVHASTPQTTTRENTRRTHITIQNTTTHRTRQEPRTRNSARTTITSTRARRPSRTHTKHRNANISSQSTHERLESRLIPMRLRRPRQILQTNSSIQHQSQSHDLTSTDNRPLPLQTGNRLTTRDSLSPQDISLLEPPTLATQDSLRLKTINLRPQLVHTCLQTDTSTRLDERLRTGTIIPHERCHELMHDTTINGASIAPGFTLS